MDRLNEAARRAVSNVLVHKIREYANSKLVGAIDLGFSPTTLTIGRELFGAVSRSQERITRIVTDHLSEENLIAVEQKYRTEIEQSFSSGTWLKNLPGREILKALVHLENLPVGYEVLRNLIVSRMKDKGVKPTGMKSVIERIRDS